MDKNVLGTASVMEVFMVTVGKGGKVPIFGSQALTGELHSKHLYQVIRGDEVIAEGLSLSGLKHHKKNVSLIEKGQECGISFNSKHGVDFDFQRGDVLECYEEVESALPKFSMKAGLEKTF